ncbi:hypothetical protein OG21DRAFT_1606756 [Imleria badia]|nr:hypothetical protein OG21DRAFT_1606756 [Imleria badia]
MSDSHRTHCRHETLPLDYASSRLGWNGSEPVLRLDVHSVHMYRGDCEVSPWIVCGVRLHRPWVRGKGREARRETSWITPLSTPRRCHRVNLPHGHERDEQGQDANQDPDDGWSGSSAMDGHSTDKDLDAGTATTCFRPSRGRAAYPEAK